MIKEIIKKLVNKENLTESEMKSVIAELMTGKTTDAQNAAFLTALAIKGETVLEITSAATIMRDLATKVDILNPADLVDPVGTGGTGTNMFNVSTACCFVASCAGAKIAKHGNRAASSKSGSADLLETAGAKIDLNATQMAGCVDNVGIGFMFAPMLHSAMKYVIKARKEIAIRTIFNLLGPLTNPSFAKRQVLGVFSDDWLLKMAEVSKELGQKRVMVVHSEDGLDEISICGKTNVCELNSEEITNYQINPKDFGINYDNYKKLQVNSPQESLNLIKDAFDGIKGEAYDIITLNSAAILYVCEIVNSYEEGIIKAREILDSKQANIKLENYVKYTNKL